MAKRKDQSRTPSEILRQRVKELREARGGWTQQDLADALKPYCTDPKGPNIDDRATIGKIEAGHRGVSLDEAFALAGALSVAPVNLFLPVDHAMVAIGDLRVSTSMARAWAMGRSPLIEEEGGPVLEGQDAAFYRTQAPDEEWQPEASMSELLAELEVLQRRLSETYVPELPATVRRKRARRTRGK